MEERLFRNKITWFVFCFSVLVIWSHSYNVDLYASLVKEALWLEKTEWFLGGMIAQIAVPGFFMISGYLFYRNFEWGSLHGKCKSRIRSLLIPYIIWNILYYIGYLVASRIPMLGELIGKGRLIFTFDGLADAILNHSCHPVFWYLKQLIILVMMTPLIYLFSRKWCIAVPGLVVLWQMINIQMKSPFINLDALFYYLIASTAARNNKVQLEYQWTKKRAFQGIALFLLGTLMYIIYFLDDQVGYLVLSRCMIPIALWYIIAEDQLPVAKSWMNINFFLYAIHFSFVRLINKLIAYLHPTAIITPLLIYISMPVIVVIVTYWTAQILRLICPKGWGILTGYRY